RRPDRRRVSPSGETGRPPRVWQPSNREEPEPESQTTVKTAGSPADRLPENTSVGWRFLPESQPPGAVTARETGGAHGAAECLALPRCNAPQSTSSPTSGSARYSWNRAPAKH